METQVCEYVTDSKKIFLPKYVNLLSMLHIAFASFFIKATVSALGTIPGTYIVRWLKYSESIDIYDTNISFNPFKFSV